MGDAQVAISERFGTAPARKMRGLLGGLVMILLALVFLSPVSFVLINSVKTDAEYLSSKIELPSEVLLVENYGETMRNMRFGRVLFNSVAVTAASALGIVVLGSMAAYKLARVPGLVSTVIFFLFLSIMIIPFQAVMIPIVVVVGRLGLINTLHGIVLTYWGLVTPPAIFLYHGFVKTIPKGIEESVMMDGGNSFQIFWYVIFPLLKPITATTAALLSLQIWNDFLLPLLLLQSPRIYTIQLAIMQFFQAYNTAWSNILAAVVLGSLPMLLLFAVSQKAIIAGVTSGALKG